MAGSMTIPKDLKCSTCGDDFVADVWVLVLADERPDLIERIGRGELRVALCPRNGHPNVLPDAPLLLYRGNAEPRLVFATASGTLADPVEQQAFVGLRGELRDALGDIWRDEWAFDTQVVAAAFLPTMLNADLEGRVRDQLSAMVHLGWGARRDYIRAHPELLSDAALAVIDQAVGGADRQLDRDAEDVLGDLRDLVIRSRQVGIDQAFEDRAPQRVFERATPELDLPILTSLLKELAANGVDLENVEEVERAIDGNPAWRQRYEESRRAMLDVLLDKASRLTAPSELEQRADTYRQALELLGADDDPGLRTMLLFELAGTLLQPIGRREAAVAEAVAAYESALSALDGHNAPAERLAIQRNLSAAYRLRGLEGDQERAESALTEATALAARLGNTEERAGLLIGQANLLRERARGAGGDDGALTEAIGLYQQVLGDPALAAAPDARPTALHCLALAHAALVGGDRTENLRTATEYCRAALELRAVEQDGTKWLGTMATLGRIEADWVGVDAGRSTEASASAYGAALTYAQENGLLLHTRDLGEALGRLHTQRLEWTPAADAYRHAVDAAERMYAASTTDEARRTELLESTSLLGSAGYALARAGRLEAAALVLEQSRARGLGQYLDRQGQELEQLAQTHPDLAARYRKAAARLNQLDAHERGADDLGPGTVEATKEKTEVYARRAAADFDAVVAEIRTIPEHREVLASATIEDLIRPLADREVGALLCVTDSGTLSLLLTKSGTEPKLAAVWSDLTRNDLLALVTSSDGGPGYVSGQLGDATALRQSLPNVLSVLGASLVGPLAAEIATLDGDHVVLIPGGLLALLPIHAARYGDGRSLLDDLEVSYAPSLRVLAAARSSLATRAAREPYLAGAGNPLPTPRPLEFAEYELREVAHLFPELQQDVMLENGATELALLWAASRATHVHFACHGFFDQTAPLDSYLALAEGDRLTLGEIMGRRHFENVRLVVMSACQTAVTEFRSLPDEAIGLPAGMLRAGVSGVVGALWPVSDLSTAVLMVHFYRYHLVGDPISGEGPMSPASALRRAQQRVAVMTRAELAQLLGEAGQPQVDGRRDLLPPTSDLPVTSVEHPFADPYHWAGFTFNGA